MGDGGGGDRHGLHGASVGVRRYAENRRRANWDDDAGDGARPGPGNAEGLGQGRRQRTVLVAVLGERIAFDNPDSLTLLGALAAWTDRVRLVTTVIVPHCTTR